MTVIDILKGQVNCMNALLVVIVMAVVARYWKKPRLSSRLFLFAVVLFLVVSTKPIPTILVGRLESLYPPYSAKQDTTEQPVYIFVLGGGYAAQAGLPAITQLSDATLARLVEAIRIHRLVPGSRIICSGYASSGERSLAWTVRDAAISLGVPGTELEMIETTTTTWMEAAEFKRNFGSAHPVILVTDAIHMKRAILTFEAHGLRAHAAPTNYLVRDDEKSFLTAWLPHSENMLIIDRWIREQMGLVKLIIQRSSR